MAIYSIQITSHEETYAPPTEVLKVGAVDDIIFLTISDYDENTEGSTTDNSREIGVHVQDLLAALRALGESVD